MNKGFDPCQSCSQRMKMCAGCNYLALRVEAAMRASASSDDILAVAGGKACEVCTNSLKPFCLSATGGQLCNSFSWRTGERRIQPIGMVTMGINGLSGYPVLDIVQKMNELIEVMNGGR